VVDVVGDVVVSVIDVVVDDVVPVVVDIVVVELDDVEMVVVVISRQVTRTSPVLELLHANSYLALQALTQLNPSHDEASAKPSCIGSQPAPSQQKHEHTALAFVVDTYMAATRPTSRRRYLLNISDPFI